jgi:hypothetical protein
MKRLFLPGTAIVLLLLLTAPTSAVLVIATSDVSPPVTALKPGTPATVTATVAISPSGETTFSEGHSLQLETNLIAPQWTVQVVVDGYPNARFTQSTKYISVNGFLLSFSTNRDVEVQITVSGDTPTSGNLLAVTELDNAGKPVPGSAVAIAAPAFPVTTRPIATAAPTTIPTTAATPSRPASVAFAPIIVVVVAVAVLHATGRRR